MKTGQRNTIVTRILGVLVCLVGVVLIVLVFQKALELFSAKPSDALGITFTSDPKKDPSGAAIGVAFGWLILRLFCLFLMALAGSLISQRGVNLYFSANQPSTPNKQSDTSASANG